MLVSIINSCVVLLLINSLSVSVQCHYEPLQHQIRFLRYLSPRVDLQVAVRVNYSTISCSLLSLSCFDLAMHCYTSNTYRSFQCWHDIWGRAWRSLLCNSHWPRSNVPDGRLGCQRGDVALLVQPRPQHWEDGHYTCQGGSCFDSSCRIHAAYVQ